MNKTHLTLFLFALIALAITGCGCAPRPPAGSAESMAAGEQARVATLQKSADAAKIQAAKSDAIADELDDAALRLKTQAAIDSAVAARNKATTDKQVAAALAEVLDGAKSDFDSAYKKADAERIKNADAAERRHFQYICQLVGMALVVLGFISGGILAYVEFRAGMSLATGAWLAGIASATGVAVAIFGAAQPWLLALGCLVAVAALVVWGLRHHRAHQDAIPGQIPVTVAPTGVADQIVARIESIASEAKSVTQADLAALEAKIKNWITPVK